jgi:Ca2+-binding EF-hand superfamily protein
MLRSVVPKLLAFRRLPWLKRKLLQVIAYRLPDAVDEDVLITWFELDRDRCGRVSRQNLNEALPDGGEDPAFTVALRELLRDMVSEEPEGYVGFTVFVAAMLDKDRHMTLASLRSAFVLLDLDGNGQINFQELQFAVDMQVCSHATVDNSFFECGRAPSSLKSDEMMSRCLEESQRVLDRYDSDNDKAMSFAEFRVFMLDNDLVSSL